MEHADDPETINQDEVETQLPEGMEVEQEAASETVHEEEESAQIDEEEAESVEPEIAQEEEDPAEVEDEAAKENDPNADNATPAPTEEGEEPKAEKLTRLPLGRVKNIIKMDPDTKMASQDAVFLITKATELFVDSLAKECYSYTTQNKKKTIARIDIDTAVDATDCLAFLEGALED